MALLMYQMSFVKTQLGKSCPNLATLLMELGTHVELSSDEYSKLFYLELKLKSEFSDLVDAKEKIFSEFMKFYKMVSENPQEYFMSANFSEEWVQMNSKNSHNIKDIKSILDAKRTVHENLSKRFCKTVWEKLFFGLGEVRNGGIKSLESSMESCKAGFDELEDVMRARFVAKDFKNLGFAYKRLMNELKECSVLIKIKNSFQKLMIDSDGDKKTKPYLAINLKLGILGVPYELQMMTENAELIGKLDHPVRVRRKVQLSEESMHLLNALSWGSHLMDYRKLILNI